MQLVVNPTKTELMLFTMKTKIPNFNLPRLNGQRLELSHKAKLLGVILNPWELNIDERVRKACKTITPATEPSVKPGGQLFQDYITTGSIRRSNWSNELLSLSGT